MAYNILFCHMIDEYYYTKLTNREIRIYDILLLKKKYTCKIVISQEFYLRFVILFYDTNNYNNFFDYINLGVATPNISLQ